MARHSRTGETQLLYARCKKNRHGPRAAPAETLIPYLAFISVHAQLRFAFVSLLKHAEHPLWSAQMVRTRTLRRSTD